MAGGWRSFSVCLRIEGGAAGGGYFCVAGDGWLAFAFSVFVYGGGAAGWVFLCGGSRVAVVRFQCVCVWGESGGGGYLRVASIRFQ